MKKRYLVTVTFIIPVLSVSAAYLLYMLLPLGYLENKLYDHRMRGRVGSNISDAIRVIVVDDQSVQMGNRWPWPWTDHAGVLSFLSRTDVSAVGVDILFESYEKEMHGLEALRYFSKLTGRTVFQYYFRTFREKGQHFYRDYYAYGADEPLRNYRVNITPEAERGITAAESYNLPVSELHDAGRLGFANAAEDEDGVVRKVPLLIRYSDHYYPSFVLMLLCIHLNKDVSDIVAGRGYVSITGTDIRIPVDGSGSMRVSYRGGLKDFKGDPAVQILNSDYALSHGETSVVPPSDYSGKVVIYGTGMTGGYDIGLMPVSSSRQPLFLVHTNALNTILTGDYVREVPLYGGVLILFLLAFVTGAANIVHTSRFYIPATAFLTVSFAGFAYYAFVRWGLYLNLVLPILTAGLCFTGTVVYKQITERKSKGYVKKVLGQYISRDVMDMLLKDPSKLRLHGEWREMTVLFSDIKGFTTLCEGSDAGKVVTVLNEFFDRMTGIILSHNGTLNKYIGDALVAFWNAPLRQEDHARLAVTAALSMVREIKEMGSAGGECRGIDIGIGINTGDMVVGNMGSRYIYDYTVIGENVNIASRIESLTRMYPYRIIITEGTYRYLNGDFEAEFIGEVSLKGMSKKVRLYGMKE